MLCSFWTRISNIFFVHSSVPLSVRQKKINNKTCFSLADSSCEAIIYIIFQLDNYAFYYLVQSIQ